MTKTPGGAPGAPEGETPGAPEGETTSAGATGVQQGEAKAVATGVRQGEAETGKLGQLPRRFRKALV